MIDFPGLIQPDLIHLTYNFQTYQDKSVLTIQKYKPDFLILHENFYADDIPGFLNTQCQLIQIFQGNDYNFVDMEIYKCDF